MLSQSEIISRLEEGNARFISGNLNNDLQDARRRSILKEGQAPFAIILGCADSRVIPELVFDTGLGELFVVRVAGNIANTSSIASIEYAVSQLDVRVIIVLGHENCGAVTAALLGGDNGYNLNHLLSQINPAIVAAGDNSSLEKVVKINAKKSAQSLANRSEIIYKALEKGQLSIVPAYYHLESGTVEFMH